MAQPKNQNQNQLSPNHVKRMQMLLGSTRTPQMAPHPLVVPPSPTPDPAGGGDDQLIPAKSGEYIIPEPVVNRKGTQFFDNLVKKTLAEVMPPDQAALGGTGTSQTGFQWGGETGDGWSEPGELNQNVASYLDGGPQWMAAANQSGALSISGNNNLSGNPFIGSAPNLWSPFGNNPTQSPGWQDWANATQQSYDPNSNTGPDWANTTNTEYGPTNYNPWNFFSGLSAPFASNGFSYDPQLGYVPNAVPVFGGGTPMYNPTDPVGAEHLGQHLSST